MGLFNNKNQEDNTQKYIDNVIQSLKLTGIYQSTPILITDHKKNIIYANERFENDFGYKKEEIEGCNTDIINSGLHSRSYYQKLDKVLYSSEVFVEYINSRTKNNDLIRSRLKIIPLEDQLSHEKYFLCLYDIVENDLSFKDDITESYKILLELVEQSPDIICIKDGDGRWLLANSADLALFHLSGVDYRGKTDAQLASETHPVYREAFLTCMDTDNECWKRGELSRSDEIISIPGGGQVVLDVLKIPVFNKDNSRKNLIVLGRDVTKRRNTEKDLMIAKVKAEESDKLKTSFLATMSHELRTPLNAVIGFSNLIEAEQDLNEIYDYTRIIHNNAKSLLNLIEDLFDISLIEANQMNVVLSDIDVISIIKDVYDIFPVEIHKLDKLNIKLSLHIDVEKFMIKSDMFRIKQVITNLVKNSLKFTHEGEISISFKYDDQWAYIVVADTGIGIAEDKLETVFEKFRQVEDSSTRKFGGAGLGLAISKKLAILMGGDLTVSSQKGKGSKFIFSLPR